MSLIYNDPSAVIKKALDVLESEKTPTLTPKTTANLPPPAKNAAPAANSALPTLAVPLSSTLSLESIFEAINFEGRRVECKASLAKIAEKIKQRQESNVKEMAELQKKIDNYAKDQRRAVWGKVFKIIGMIVSALSILAAVMTGGALAFLSAICLTCLLAADIGDLAVGGDCIAKMLQACGVDEKNSMIASMIIKIILVVVSAGCSLGSAAGKGGSFANMVVGKQLEAASQVGVRLTKPLADLVKTFTSLEKLSKGLTATLAVTSTASRGIDIADAKAASDSLKSDATIKEIQSIIAKLLIEIETEEQLFKTIMEKTRAIIDTTAQIVTECNDAQGVVLGGATTKA